ncbi:MAG: hypothetical protein AAFP70_09620 [Calditrichota bacterium]
MFFNENDTSGKPQFEIAVKMLWITLVMTLVNVAFQPTMIQGLLTNSLFLSMFVGFFAFNSLLIYYISKREKIALYCFMGLFVLGTPTYVKYILILRHEITTTMFVNVVVVILQLIAILMLFGPPGSQQFDKTSESSELSKNN